MKIKISITLSSSLLPEIDRQAGKSGSRSAFVERALRAFLEANARRASQVRDRKLLDAASGRLNKEVFEIL
jgi:metal-responsive CopG/Arc/MetJ family transcriptional regulator